MTGQPADGRASRPSIAAILIAVTCLAACAPSAPPPPADPLTVVEAWVDARNDGDVEAAMSMLPEEGEIFGVGIHLPGSRDRLRATFEGQAVAGWTIEETDCRVEGESVTCRYRQLDDVLRRWDLTLTGEHLYVVRDGQLARVRRTHDPSSARAAYAAADDFRAWVRAEHPELVDVIWADLSSALYTTPEGARAVLELLDEYEATGGP